MGLRSSQLGLMPRQATIAITPVTASMAAVWRPTAASAMAMEPVAVSSRAGVSDRHSGISAGTSISPEPCAVDIISDHSASAAGSPGARRCRHAKRHS